MTERGGDWRRSYLRRQGQATAAQKRALRAHWPRFGLRYAHGEVLALDAHFGRRAPVTLEIGFGQGETLVALARRHPERDILGLEVHVPGIGAALQRLAEADLPNVRVMRADAIPVLAEHLAEGALAEACVFFPDPWPREKDADRRLVRPLLLTLLARALQPGGRLHVATDDPTYAAHVTTVLSGSAWTGGRVARPDWRPVTRYEARARACGSEIHDFCFRAPCVRPARCPPTDR